MRRRGVLRPPSSTELPRSPRAWHEPRLSRSARRCWVQRDPGVQFAPGLGGVPAVVAVAGVARVRPDLTAVRCHVYYHATSCEWVVDMYEVESLWRYYFFDSIGFDSWDEAIDYAVNAAY